ncbi:hypothetical protein N825_33400 [Skermanella stibiiresistens SB22]|uniref:Addiction module antitoxin n=1 Tax=Skermanella stibiiresistens SB22 TaxID=1385369 RepID=W9HAE3_9PROT|nr:type II toxin-antitoxin system RelE/ParE family toxin [Skermanella stibiiresistens]EWY40828.1 hypothetical protein N825_33400 [Skermanella stibiiresistens SB22]
MRIRYPRRALLDLNNQEDHIAETNPAAALEQVAIIRRHVDGLIDQPCMGRPGRISGTRELIISSSPFLVAYRVTDRTVDVLAVIHAKRNCPRVL